MNKLNNNKKDKSNILNNTDKTITDSTLEKSAIVWSEDLFIWKESFSHQSKNHHNMFNYFQPVSIVWNGDKFIATGYYDLMNNNESHFRKRSRWIFNCC